MNIYLQCTFDLHLTCNKQEKKRWFYVSFIFCVVQTRGLILHGIPLPFKSAYRYIHSSAILMHTLNSLPTCMDTVESYKKASTYLLKPKPKQNQQIMHRSVLQSRHPPQGHTLPELQQQTSDTNTTLLRVHNDQRTAYFKAHFLLVLHVLP